MLYWNLKKELYQINRSYLEKESLTEREFRSGVFGKHHIEMQCTYRVKLKRAMCVRRCF